MIEAVTPRRWTAAVLLALAAALGGCASVPNPNPDDPFEGYNRGMQRFNDAVDDAVLAPVARTWRDQVPSFVRTGVGNFFGNLDDAWSAVNHLLQAKPEPALTMTMRVAVNSVFGFGGLLDIGTEAGLERQSEDFGQTLGRWGLPAGPYLVLPLLGPSSVRDTAGRPLDMAATSTARIGLEEAQITIASLLNVVDTRARLLGASRLLEQAALDRYVFLRDAYLARRRNLVYDGDPPPLPEPDWEEPAAR
ncbi:MAG TPA: VacJ family lipoprotein [Rubrivivax sp.]|jgi:phospholipid-binding lipoprotein MlaA|nr:VacJ family lipoprotein [Rhodoferax sp.]MCP5287993.1 VacJ family lipoprotein [Burkholderiaceae bacterium]HMR69313.1 VacJ family lipoprotein [Rubrivivax sp.]